MSSTEPGIEPTEEPTAEPTAEPTEKPTDEPIQTTEPEGGQNDWAVIDKDITIDLNSTDYFGGTSPSEGYYGADENTKYVYAGGANNFVENKVVVDDARVGGYQVKTATAQMIGIRVKAGATVTAYYAAGGSSRNIYMVDKQVKYDDWGNKGVKIFASADDTEKTLSHTFTSDTEVYFAASSPCYIAKIDVTMSSVLPSEQPTDQPSSTERPEPSLTNWAVIDKNITIDLNSFEYFGETTPTQKGYYGLDENTKYVYAGGANNMVEDKVKIDKTRVNGYLVKTAVDQMLGIKVKAGATVTVYYAAGGASRSIYMVDKLVAYDDWANNGVNVFESAELTDTISHTFDADTEVYFAASAPCYMAKIEVSYPATGNETYHFGLDGSDEDITMSGDYSYEVAQIGNGINLNGGKCDVSNISFANDYTITAWIKPSKIEDNMSLFKFKGDDGRSLEYIINSSLQRTQLNIVSGGISKTIEFTSPFKEKIWTHVAIVMKNKTAYIY